MFGIQLCVHSGNAAFLGFQLLVGENGIIVRKRQNRQSREEAGKQYCDPQANEENRSDCPAPCVKKLISTSISVVSAGSNPGHSYIPMYRIMVYFWILFGLAFMATFMNLISERIKLRGKFHGIPQRAGEILRQTYRKCHSPIHLQACHRMHRLSNLAAWMLLLSRQVCATNVMYSVTFWSSLKSFLPSRLPRLGILVEK